MQLDLFSDTKTAIESLRDQVMEDAERGGTHCPVCTQFVKIYKRQVYHTIAKELINLYHLPKGFHHVGEFKIDGPSIGGDIAILGYWDLIEPKPNPDDKSKRCSGIWRITELGQRFVEDTATIPKFAHVYNSKVLGFSGPPKSIREALGKKWNYSELMSS